MFTNQNLPCCVQQSIPKCFMKDWTLLKSWEESGIKTDTTKCHILGPDLTRHWEACQAGVTYLHICRQMCLSKCGGASIDGWVMWWSWGNEKGEDSEPQPVPGFTNLHSAYEIAKAFFYQHSNWCSFSWNIRLKLHSRQLQIFVGKLSNVYIHIKVTSCSLFL